MQAPQKTSIGKDGNYKVSERMTGNDNDVTSRRWGFARRQSSLWDSVISPLFPALKRRAIIDTPSGVDFLTVGSTETAKTWFSRTR